MARGSGRLLPERRGRQAAGRREPDGRSQEARRALRQVPKLVVDDAPWIFVDNAIQTAASVKAVSGFSSILLLSLLQPGGRESVAVEPARADGEKRWAGSHIIPADRVHYRWDNSIRPVLEIEPGDVVIYDLREVSDGQITPGRDGARSPSPRHDPRLSPGGTDCCQGRPPRRRPGDRDARALRREAGAGRESTWIRGPPRGSDGADLHIWDLSAGTAGDPGQGSAFHSIRSAAPSATRPRH